MVIRRSSTGEVQRLVAELTGGAPDRREAAVARLRVIGDRAVRQVVAALDTPSATDVQVALLRVLEGRQDADVVGAAARAMASSDSDVRAAAVSVARGVIDQAGGAALLERLVEVALSQTEPVPVRLAATAALASLPGRAARPVLEQLAGDADPAIRLAATPRGAQPDEPGAEIEDAAAGHLPADPQRLLDALARDAALVPLPTLHRLVSVLRAREEAERKPFGRRDWLTVRGAVHRALAARESRVALYDVKETVERAQGPLPPGFVDVLAAIGDTAAIDALAAADTRSATGEEAWRAEISAAASAIAARERLTRRSAAVKRLASKWGDEVVVRLLGIEMQGGSATRNAKRGTRN